MKRLSQRSAQGKKEFLNEAKLLSRVQHKNVVNLLGYCVHDTEKLLVYEYVANQSLDKLLFSKFFLLVFCPLRFIHNLVFFYSLFSFFFQFCMPN